MKDIKGTITWVTAVLVIHAVIAQIEMIPEWINYIIYIVSPLLVIHLALKILFSSETTEKRWEDGYFYQDREALFDPEVVKDGEN